MASAYLNKTLGGTGNKDKWTFSCWVKRHNTGVIHPLLHADDNSSNYYTHISFHDTDQLFFQNRWNNGNDGYKITTRMFRDTNAWYHLQFVWDSGNATADDRQIIYVNGERLTEFGGANVAVTQNRNTTINDGYEHRIGRGDTGFNSSQYADITLTHVHFADGQAYAPTVFGETDSTSGIWKPITNPSVTYGTNGFFLKMENSGAMGTDSSGNSNTFTVNGTLTQNVDTPSNNFCTLNPLDVGRWSQSNTFSNGNLTVTTSDYIAANGSLAVSSGKWYWEFKHINSSASNVYAGGGVINFDGWNGQYAGGSGANTYIYATSGQKSNSASSSSFGATLSSGDIVGVALDLDNGFLYFSKNGTWQNSGDPTSGSSGTGNAYSGLSGTFTAHLSDPYDGQDHDFSINFGQGYFGTTQVASAGTAPSEGGIFEYDCPSGYQALCTKGINSF